MNDIADGSPYHVLARKYRPADFSTLIGQEAMVRTLRNALESGRLAHAFMLTGVRGVGKTSTARIIAKALNCIGRDGKSGPTMDPCGACEHCVAIAEDRHVDVQEMDAASRTGIDDIREIIEGVRYRPASARYKVYIIDEVHMLSRQAFNGLLKTLEEPPPHVKFLFATTEIRKVPVTVLSRCQRFDLRRVPIDVLSAHFARIAEAEKVEIAPEALRLVAHAADGSVRDGLSLLDQAIAHGGGVVDAGQVRDMLGLADRGRVFDLFDLLMKGDAPAVLALLGDMYDSGADPVVVLQDLLELTHWLTRLKVVPDAAATAAELERTRGADMAKRLAMAHLTRAWQMLLKGLQETQSAPSPIRAAEMAMIRLCYAADLPTPAEALRALNDASAGSVGAAPPAGRGAPAGPAGGTGTAVRTPPAPPPRPSPPPNAPVARLASVNAAVAVAPAAGAVPAQADAPPKPSPATFAEIVELFEQRREPKLAHHLSRDVYPVRCEPGRLEFRPQPTAPRDLAPRVADVLSQWTGRRWMVSVSGDAGEPTLQQQRVAAEDARRARAMAHPMVQAAMELFPGATLEAVRSKDEAGPATIVAENAGVSDDVPEAEEYPTDAYEEIPERDY
ncbi:DNA polymerase III subunit gamma/tau [Reyranella sp. CPCC 100927]|uniref:DNA polymerase III subunit gamma/tau n=1 Tax=Reyranella sp. CPCC 100927 TaxID=2599616 RepID=UPI0011B62E06|nr:DNA polymerase III subunit gamma/tau [Reyranella sp. CPCC 100927]TWT03084.1 DNA polymerase III subunit gamma/tau [Reyranella sp. CPCC 100927]